LCMIKLAGSGPATQIELRPTQPEKFSPEIN
jgi:hypothetical protein